MNLFIFVSLYGGAAGNQPSETTELHIHGIRLVFHTEVTLIHTKRQLLLVFTSPQTSAGRFTSPSLCGFHLDVDGNNGGRNFSAHTGEK